MNDPDKAVNDKISADLGIDVTFVEAQTRFRLDHLRMTEGQPGQLGYVLMERAHHPNAAIVYPDRDTATRALTSGEDLLIEDLTEKDCLDAGVPDVIHLGDLANREIIFPEEVHWVVNGPAS